MLEINKLYTLLYFFGLVSVLKSFQKRIKEQIRSISIPVSVVIGQVVVMKIVGAGVVLVVVIGFGQ